MKTAIRSLTLTEPSRFRAKKEEAVVVVMMKKAVVTEGEAPPASAVTEPRLFHATANMDPGTGGAMSALQTRNRSQVAVHGRAMTTAIFWSAPRMCALKLVAI
jgi:hypothetical protein